jgi:hypothetical protein
MLKMSGVNEPRVMQASDVKYAPGQAHDKPGRATCWTFHASRGLVQIAQEELDLKTNQQRG